MARLPRIEVPGVPQHVIVRGNNRAELFRDDADRQVFLTFLEQGLEACACDLHAFVLMGNHVHLLATGHVTGELSELMQRVGRKFARLMNIRWERTGTLFEGRFRSSLVDSESYLLTCMRYIELNPVRAGIVDHPARYYWSSYRENASGSPRTPIRPHELYRRLARTDDERGARYRRLVDAGLSDDELARIRESARKCRALGTESFCAEMSGRLDRSVAPRPQGRPRKNGDRLKNEPDPI
jgi:putative transposase